jgi:hypothetical protein
VYKQVTRINSRELLLSMTLSKNKFGGNKTGVSKRYISFAAWKVLIHLFNIYMGIIFSRNKWWFIFSILSEEEFHFCGANGSH